LNLHEETEIAGLLCSGGTRTEFLFFQSQGARLRNLNLGAIEAAESLDELQAIEFGRRVDPGIVVKAVALAGRD